jgi:hypothetical protein
MYWLTNLLGGKSFFFWIGALVLAVQGKLSPENYQLATFAWMGAQAIEDGVTKPLNPAWTVARRIWSFIGGRGLFALIASTVLLLSGYCTEAHWLGIGFAFLGKGTVETAIAATRVKLNGVK